MSLFYLIFVWTIRLTWFFLTGPYFCGDELTLIDITFAPFLERMAASLAYYKGFRLEGNGGRWPNIDAWYEAMAKRTETYRL